MHRSFRSILSLLFVALVSVPSGYAYADPDNPNIDMVGFLQMANEAAVYRQLRRITEDDFIRRSKEPGTIILDARSKEKYDLLHIAGATNLDFSDISS